eukprot:JP438922.1.p1 GENE.JP438922.1~~JP438922.1.p1  ORF type:complete len:139 (+),score=11.66 JP438922.1:2-418(+)
MSTEQPKGENKEEELVGRPLAFHNYVPKDYEPGYFDFTRAPCFREVMLVCIPFSLITGLATFWKHRSLKKANNFAVTVFTIVTGSSWAWCRTNAYFAHQKTTKMAEEMREEDHKKHIEQPPPTPPAELDVYVPKIWDK